MCIVKTNVFHFNFVMYCLDTARRKVSHAKVFDLNIINHFIYDFLFIAFSKNILDEKSNRNLIYIFILVNCSNVFSYCYLLEIWPKCNKCKIAGKNIYKLYINFFFFYLKTIITTVSYFFL